MGNGFNAVKRRIANSKKYLSYLRCRFRSFEARLQDVHGITRDTPSARRSEDPVLVASFCQRLRLCSRPDHVEQFEIVSSSDFGHAERIQSQISIMRHIPAPLSNVDV